MTTIWDFNQSSNNVCKYDIWCVCVCIKLKYIFIYKHNVLYNSIIIPHTAYTNTKMIANTLDDNGKPLLLLHRAPGAPGAPSWAEKVAKNIPEEIKRVIDEETRLSAEKKAQEAQAKRELWKKRSADREDRMKKQAEAREQQHVANMREKYGKYWYNVVVGGPEDCEIAQELCHKDLLDYEHDKRVQYIKEMKYKAEKNKNKQTVSYAEYMAMSWPDDDFLPENHPIRQNFALYASWAANSYYSKYGKMRPDNHFLGTAWGSELNPEVVERERIAEEKKYKELGKPVPRGRYGKIIGYDIAEFNR